mmetsp:Transcript_8196/g.24105  ORF Transcript_8196/g.24105 Transcript_8196/m.24105 type:complete len:245 (+) Transcript_8196:869-1603(+)
MSPPVSRIASFAIFFVNPMFTSISTGPSALGLSSPSSPSSSFFLLFFDFFVIFASGFFAPAALFPAAVFFASFATTLVTSFTVAFALSSLTVFFFVVVVVVVIAAAVSELTLVSLVFAILTANNLFLNCFNTSTFSSSFNSSTFTSSTLTTRFVGPNPPFTPPLLWFFPMYAAAPKPASRTGFGISIASICSGVKPYSRTFSSLFAFNCSFSIFPPWFVINPFLRTTSSPVSASFACFTANTSS